MNVKGLNEGESGEAVLFSMPKRLWSLIRKPGTIGISPFEMSLLSFPFGTTALQSVPSVTISRIVDDRIHWRTSELEISELEIRELAD